MRAMIPDSQVTTADVDIKAVPRLSRALYSIKETEALLSISHAQVYRLINDGRLDARKIGAKTVITAASLESFLALLPKLGHEARR